MQFSKYNSNLFPFSSLLCMCETIYQSTEQCPTLFLQKTAAFLVLGSERKWSIILSRIYNMQC